MSWDKHSPSDLHSSPFLLIFWVKCSVQVANKWGVVAEVQGECQCWVPRPVPLLLKSTSKKITNYHLYWAVRTSEKNLEHSAPKMPNTHNTWLVRMNPLSFMKFEAYTPIQTFKMTLKQCTSIKRKQNTRARDEVVWFLLSWSCSSLFASEVLLCGSVSHC